MVLNEKQDGFDPLPESYFDEYFDDLKYSGGCYIPTEFRPGEKLVIELENHGKITVVELG